MVGVSDASAIGVDIEPAVVDGTFGPKFLSPGELELVERFGDTALGLALVWASKEAILKASGKGLVASEWPVLTALNRSVVPFDGALWSLQRVGTWDRIATVLAVRCDRQPTRPAVLRVYET